MAIRETKDLPVWAIKLKRFRLSKGLTQKGFANILDLSAMSIAAYEQGLRRPKQQTMDLMHEKIGLDIYEIFFNEKLEDFTCKK